jgi:hypothetical protein
MVLTDAAVMLIMISQRLSIVSTSSLIEMSAVVEDFGIGKVMTSFPADIILLTWTPEAQPVLIRASLSARLGQDKPHETQTPQWHRTSASNGRQTNC